jgi:hypothetical protein
MTPKSNTTQTTADKPIQQISPPLQHKVKSRHHIALHWSALANKMHEAKQHKHAGKAGARLNDTNTHRYDDTSSKGQRSSEDNWGL